MRHPIHRRTLLRGALGLAGLSLSQRLSLGALISEDELADAGTLVILQLSGGNDGLSTVIPFADDAYAAARRSTRFAQDEVLGLDDYLGLHPELQHIRSEFESGRAAIVQGVGYSNPNRSHFKSMDIWHSASPDGRAVKSGWVGRLSEALSTTGYNPERVVHIGGSLPYSLHSKSSPAVSFVQPDNYRWVGNEPEMNDVADQLGSDSNSESSGGAIGHLRGVMRDAAASSRRIRSAAAQYETHVDYPGGELARSLRTAAALIKSELGCRVVSLEQTGFDTHQGQRVVHTRLMSQLDAALRAFQADLAGSAAGRKTVILAFSEFGRRIVENGSNGTDHGTAGPMFLLGPSVSGGLHGAHPSLTDRDGDDLIFHTDFRSVYATVIEKHFGVDSAGVLGGSYAQLPLLG